MVIESCTATTVEGEPAKYRDVADKGGRYTDITGTSTSTVLLLPILGIHILKNFCRILKNAGPKS
jgi:hypothetical protein